MSKLYPYYHITKPEVAKGPRLIIFGTVRLFFRKSSQGTDSSMQSGDSWVVNTSQLCETLKMSAKTPLSHS